MQELTIFQKPLSREVLTDEKSLNQIIYNIQDLRNLEFDFTTNQGIEEAKSLKKYAKDFIKNLKDWCEPLEEEGAKIAKARSRITTTFISGKENVIDKILRPITDREDTIKSMQAKLYTPLTDLDAVSARLKEIENLKNYDWLIFKNEAEPLIEQLHGLALVAEQKITAEIKAKEEAEEVARVAREEKIRAEAELNAKADAQKQIDEANKRAEQAKIDAEIKVNEIKKEFSVKPLPQTELKAIDEVARKREVNNLILTVLMTFLTEQQAKAVILNIVKGNIPNVSIKY